jgi:DNA-binding CsgD family transcriptional regulator
MQSNPSEAPPTSGAPGKAELSEREQEILRLVATGAGNKQIAQQLVISPNTVKVHLRNIFAKIDVATRTEAALFAVREGLVQVGPGMANETAPAIAVEPPQPETANPAGSPPAVALPDDKSRKARPLMWLVSSAAVVAILVLAYVVFQQRVPASNPPRVTATPAVPRWQSMPALTSARSGLAMATYDDQIYAVGGETTTGITGTTERYDPGANSWSARAPKPQPVADVGAAVIGGLIYVPGGRTPDASMTAALEVYNPRTNAWESRAPLPKALCGYALVAFEGKLFVFGGWDGTQFLSTVYTYDPASDKWADAAALSQPRAYSGVAVAGGNIYVIGGKNSLGDLALNEQYTPEKDVVGDNPWRARTPLPSSQSGIGATSIADVIYVVGGEGRPGTLGSWEYFAQSDQWQLPDAPLAAPTTRLAVTAVGTRLYAGGGLQAKTPSNQFLAYNAIYTLIIPVVTGP